MWLVSMSMGDCLFPMAHRFQAEWTRPQKDGTSGEEGDRDGALFYRRLTKTYGGVEP